MSCKNLFVPKDNEFKKREIMVSSLTCLITLSPLINSINLGFASLTNLLRFSNFFESLNLSINNSRGLDK